MMYLLLFLIPVVTLLVWAARVDRKRRRRETQVTTLMRRD